MNILIEKSNIQLKYFTILLVLTWLGKGQDSPHFNGLKTIHGTFIALWKLIFQLEKSERCPNRHIYSAERKTS